jgi:hypothetical protein
MAHPYLSQLQELVVSAGVDDTGTVCKHFFSGAALYAHGKIVASLSPKGLAFKLSGSRCESVLSEGVAVPLRYFENSPVKQGYVLFANIDQLKNDDIRRYFLESISVAAP